MSEQIEVSIIPSDQQTRKSIRRERHRTKHAKPNPENTNVVNNLLNPASLNTPARGNISDSASTRTIDTEIDGMQTNDEPTNVQEESSQQQNALLNQFMTVASYGAEFLMIDSHGEPKKSIVQVSTDGEEIQTDFGFFELSPDVLIVNGFQSKGFKKVQNLLPENLCFSLMNQETRKTLNFVAKSDQVKSLWVQGFYQLCTSQQFKKFQHQFQEFCQKEQIRLSKLSDDDVSKIRNEFRNKVKKDHHSSHKHKRRPSSHMHAHRRQSQSGRRVKRRVYKRQAHKRQSILVSMADLILGQRSHLQTQNKTEKTKPSSRRLQSLHDMSAFEHSGHLKRSHTLAIGSETNDKKFSKGFRQSVKETVNDVKEKVSGAVDQVRKSTKINKPQRGKYDNLEIVEIYGEGEQNELIDSQTDDEHVRNENNVQFQIGDDQEEDVWDSETATSDESVAKSKHDRHNKQQVADNDQLVVRTATVL